MDSSVGVVMEPSSIDVLHHLNYFVFQNREAKLRFLNGQNNNNNNLSFLKHVWIFMQQAMPEFEFAC